MKLSDYVMDFLHHQGIRHVFTVSGGGIMHLVDSLGRHPHIKYVCNYHEQACAIAAEAYSRISHGLGACLVTTGPGSTNALSGIAGAWVDSVPVIVISGQVRRDLIADYSKVRQVGPQEINIDDMARPVTKYFSTIMDPARIRYELEKAVSLATSGRPGPVWINIPLDVQGASVDPAALVGYEAPVDDAVAGRARVREQAERTLQMLSESRRPVLVPGNGIWLANAAPAWRRLVDRLGIPVCLTIGSLDLLHETHPCFMGRLGPLGQRRANFTIQNADLILALGSSLSLSTIGFNTEGFAPRAKKIMVNVDPHEIDKARPIPDVAIAADIGDFMEQLLALPIPDWRDRLDPWWRACRYWRTQYPPLTEAYFADKDHVSTYVFTSVLSDLLEEGDAVLTGNSLDIWSSYQTFKLKEGQRLFTNINYGSMGWDLPGLIGACVARNGRRTILVTGDGTIQFNIQELQTIVHNHLDVKIFVFNNGGYASIRSTQETHFGGKLVGSDASSGIGAPNFNRIAEAYGLRYVCIRNNDEIASVAGTVLESHDPVLCEVMVAYDQGRAPRIMSRRREDGSMESGTLENMFPFLPAEEIERNMNMFEATT